MKLKPLANKLPTPDYTDCWTETRILFCGHEGWFVGDVITTKFAVTVIAKKPVNPGTLRRTQLDSAKWHISDSHGGYWNPASGRFVLPRNAVTRLA